MVGTRGKGSKSKSGGHALVPDERQPLKIITAEATDGPSHSEEAKNEILNAETVLVRVSTSEEEQMMVDEGVIGFEVNDIITDGDETLLQEVLEVMSDGGDTRNSVDDKNSRGRTIENKTVGDISGGGDAVSNVDVKSSNERTNEEEPEEEIPTCDKEKVPTESAFVTNADEGLAFSENVLVENLTGNMDNDEEAVTLPAGEPVGTLAENGASESIKQNSLIAVAEKVTRPKKKIIKRKLIKKKVSQDVDMPTWEEEKGSEVSASVTNVDEGLAASEHVLVENLTGNMDNDEEAVKLPAEEQVSTLAENGDESVRQNSLIDVAGNVTPAKKKIMKKKLIKKKILPDVAATNEVKLQPSNENEESGVLCKSGTSTEVKPQCLEDDDASVEASKIENLKDEKMVEGKAIVKANKVRRTKKKNPQVQPGIRTGSAEQKPKPEPTNGEPAIKENPIIEQETKNEEAVKSKAKKRKNKKVVGEGIQSVNAKDIGEPESSKDGMLTGKSESMGMIFMCNSETKKDCYKYKILGLPAAKKDDVAKIYQGMRLFLFDVDLKMLYGIYKAACPGSYNIEPKAFNRQYPSQVRFTVLDDCLPIPEEKFKKVIKDNYFTKKRFDFKLTNVQVRDLCKLFRETKKSASKRGGQTQRAVPAPSTRVDRKRKWAEDSRRAAPGPSSSRGQESRNKLPKQARHAHVVRGHEEMRRVPVVRGHEEMRRAPVVRAQEEMRRAPIVRGQEDLRGALVVRGQEELRLAPSAIDERYRRPVVVYGREAYLPPPVASSLYQDPPRTRIYSYERDPGVDTYRRDPEVDTYRREPEVDTYRRDPVVEYRDLGISVPQELRNYADPYSTYREAHVYREPAYQTDARRDPYNYSLSDLSEGRRAEYYRSEDSRPLPPLHRRY